MLVFDGANPRYITNKLNDFININLCSYMKTDYRNIARDALTRARSELDSDDTNRLPYAALELRMALEALAYEKMVHYQNDVPPEQIGNWQPPKIMKMLAAIDANVGRDSKITVSEESSPHQHEPKIVFTGTENTLNLDLLPKHYHSLGSNLHIPTLNKLLEDRDRPNEKLKMLCESVYEDVKRVLSSSVWNVDVKKTSTHTCVRCKEPMIRRRNLTRDTQNVTCWNCGAEYQLVNLPNYKVEWKPRQISFDCPENDCGTPYYFWFDEVKVGASWTCDNCRRKWVFAFGVSPDNGQPLFAPEG